MEDLLKLVRTYRFTTGLTERLRLIDEIIPLVAPDLHAFILGSLPFDTAQDALQEVLKAVALSLKNFQGDNAKEFWSWCYRIARNKLNDHYRAKCRDRSLPMEPEELRKMIDATDEDNPISADARHDLDYAMKLLTATKPECGDLLWRHFVIGLDYGELAEERGLKYDAVRMKVSRCLDEAKALVA